MERFFFFASLADVVRHYLPYYFNQALPPLLCPLPLLAFTSTSSFPLTNRLAGEKKSNFEETVRVPLVMHVPWKPASQGKTTMALTELVDVFPTLAALSGLPAPPGVDGADLSALLDDPTAAGKEAAFHQYPACSDTEFNQTRGGCNNVARNEFDFMGYTMRTAQYRYTRWLRWNKTTLLAEWDGDYAEELYDHADDDGTTFGLYEWHNQAQANPGVRT